MKRDKILEASTNEVETMLRVIDSAPEGKRFRDSMLFAGSLEELQWIVDSKRDGTQGNPPESPLVVGCVGAGKTSGTGGLLAEKYIAAFLDGEISQHSQGMRFDLSAKERDPCSSFCAAPLPKRNLGN